MTLSARGVHRNVPCTPVCDRKVDRMRTALQLYIQLYVRIRRAHVCTAVNYVTRTSYTSD